MSLLNSRFMRHRLHHMRDRGFTLIELLVVILIIGILAAIALPNFLGQTTRAHDTDAKSALRNTYTNAKTQAVDNSGKYPTLATLLSGLADDAPEHEYLDGNVYTINGSDGSKKVTVLRPTASRIILCTGSKELRVFCMGVDAQNSFTVAAAPQSLLASAQAADASVAYSSGPNSAVAAGNLLNDQGHSTFGEAADDFIGDAPTLQGPLDPAPVLADPSAHRTNGDVIVYSGIREGSQGVMSVFLNGNNYATLYAARQPDGTARFSVSAIFAQFDAYVAAHGDPGLQGDAEFELVVTSEAPYYVTSQQASNSVVLYHGEDTYGVTPAAPVLASPLNVSQVSRNQSICYTGPTGEATISAAPVGGGGDYRSSITKTKQGGQYCFTLGELVDAAVLHDVVVGGTYDISVMVTIEDNADSDIAVKTWKINP